MNLEKAHSIVSMVQSGSCPLKLLHVALLRAAGTGTNSERITANLPESPPL